MFLNLFSNTIGYRGVLVVCFAGGLGLTASWLRHLPPRAPLAKYGYRMLLGAALLVSSLVVLGNRAPWFAFVATLLAFAAVSLAADLRKALIILSGTALVGAGIATAGVAPNLYRTEGATAFAGCFLFGAALIICGIFITRVNSFLLISAAATASLGLMFGGVALAEDGEIAAGLAMIVGACAALGAGCFIMAKTFLPFCIAIIAFGASAFAIGLCVISMENNLFSIGLLFGGATIIGGGWRFILQGKGRFRTSPPDSESYLMRSAYGTLGGLVAGIQGIVMTINGDYLLGMATAIFGLAVAAGSEARFGIKSGDYYQLWQSLKEEPASKRSVRPKRHPGIRGAQNYETR